MIGRIALVFAFSTVVWGSIGQAQAYFPASPNSIGPERIIGENNLEPIENAVGTVLWDYAQGVARVEMGGGLCTGFRIGETLMMTNNHCLSSCSSTKFRFRYERAVTREQQAVFKCVSVPAKNSQLDYAIMRVELESGDPEGIPVFSLDRRPLLDDQLLFLAGHPAGRLKEMDRSEGCKVETPPGADVQNITHTCDTEGGNSGSSVLGRETGYVVGLHWGYTSLNQATWMAHILDHVAENTPELMSELTVVE
jgi:V8-like Glu-specific endopeptidase